MKIKLKPVGQQVVVVFGASSGMGRSIALGCAARGAKVVVAARGKVGLRSLVEEIRSRGGVAEYTIADATDFGSVKAVADFAARRFGRLDTWVGCAGVWVTAKFEETKPEEFRQILETNLMGQAHGAWAALPYMRRNVRNGEAAGGALIMFSSILGRIGLPLTSAYCASKHGVIGFLDSLRVELMQEGVPIAVTAVMPYGTNTPIYNTGLSRIGFVPRPSPPIVQPEVVRDAVIYAAEHPTRDIFGSGAGRLSVLLHNFAPARLDRVLTQASTPEKQSTSKPRSEFAPHGLYTPVADYRTRGDFDDESKSFDAYVWLKTHPQVVRAAVGAALGTTAALFAARALSRPKSYQ